MTIIYVSDAIYPYNKGGKEKRLYELSTRLARLGHEVHIYTMHWWPTPEQTRMEHGVLLHAISKYYPLYNGDKRSIKEGVMFGLACLKLMTVKFDALDVDHMPFFPIYAAWIVCTLRGKRFFGTWHEALSRQDWLNYMGLAGNIAAAIERISIHMPQTIIAASVPTQLGIRTRLHRTKRVSLVTSGIDSAEIASVKVAKIPCDVLYVGRLVKDKHIDVLVEAIALLAPKRPRIHCVVIGHGIEEDNLRELINDRGLTNCVHLLAPLAKSQQVYAHMKAAKVFCLPSTREGFGIVALEALGCGTPVVTTNAVANAAQDLIQDGVDGSIVALEPSSLAAALEGWITRPRPKHIKGKAAGYDWDYLAATQSEIYAL